MARDPIPTWFFALVVVRKSDRFLVVQERKHRQLWYLPAGRVDAGETLAEAALRETLEETGIPVVLEGVLRVQHTPRSDGTCRVRVVFVARPEDDRAPKSVPDDESLRAAWVTLEELERLPLRGDEVRELFTAVAGGAPLAPLSLLGSEGPP
jgi:phosphatase NudJ